MSDPGAGSNSSTPAAVGGNIAVDDSDTLCSKSSNDCINWGIKSVDYCCCFHEEQYDPKLSMCIGAEPYRPVHWADRVNKQFWATIAILLCTLCLFFKFENCIETRSLARMMQNSDIHHQAKIKIPSDSWKQHVLLYATLPDAARIYSEETRNAVLTCALIGATFALNWCYIACKYWSSRSYLNSVRAQKGMATDEKLDTLNRAIFSMTGNRAKIFKYLLIQLVCLIVCALYLLHPDWNMLFSLFQIASVYKSELAAFVPGTLKVFNSPAAAAASGAGTAPTP